MICENYFDKKYNVQEALCLFETKINELVEMYNRIDKDHEVIAEKVKELEALIDYLLGAGLAAEVKKQLNIWLNDGTLANLINETIFKELNDKINKLSDDIDLKANKEDVEKLHSFNVLNKQKSLVNFTTFRGDEFPQGFIIIDDSLYVSRKVNNANTGSITQYRLSDMSEIKNVTYTGTSTSFYQEGLPYYKDGNDIIFLIRTTYDNNLAKLNFTTGVLGENIKVLGGSKVSMSEDGKYFYSLFGSATDTLGMFTYTMDSIKFGNPTIVNILLFDDIVPNNGSTMKIQGFTVSKDTIYLSGFSDGCGLFELDLASGNLKKIYRYNKVEMIKQIKTEMPTVVIDESKTFENEGIMLHEGQLYILNCQGEGTTKIGSSVITSLNAANGVEISYTNYADNALPLWRTIPLESGIFAYGADVIPEYMYSKGQIIIRGSAKTARGTGGISNRVITKQIPFPFRPSRTAFFTTQGSGTATNLNKLQIHKTDHIKLVSTTDTGTTGDYLIALDGVTWSAELYNK